MVWVAISSCGSELVVLEGKQISSKYVETLNQYLFLLSLNLEVMQSFFSMTVPCYTKMQTDKNFAQEQNLKVLSQFALQTLNSIENMWGLLARKVHSNGK